VTTVRSLLTTGSATHDGRKLRVTWPTAEIPIYIAASGPRTLRLAARIGDGVIVGTGIDDQSVTDSLNLISEGARSCGRDLADIDIWWNVKVSIAETRSDAIDAIAFTLASRAHYAFRPGSGSRVPASLEDRLHTLVAQYRPAEHGDHRAEHNAELVRNLGLGDFLAERFSIVGSTSEVVDRLRQLERMGVRNLFTMLQTHDGFGLGRFGREVVPQLDGSVDLS
jgi:5,10-methylenetetrahydromethanopterin reductase